MSLSENRLSTSGSNCRGHLRYLRWASRFAFGLLRSRACSPVFHALPFNVNVTETPIHFVEVTAKLSRPGQLESLNDPNLHFYGYDRNCCVRRFHSYPLVASILDLPPPNGRAENLYNGDEMEFNNLNSNILFVLCEDCCRSGAPGTYDLETLFGAFSDLPEEDVRTGLMTLSHDGFLNISASGQQVSLTSKGVARVRALHPCRKQGYV